MQRIRDVQHFGEEGGVVPDINMAATSTFLNPEDMVKTFHGEKKGCYLYSRHSNPTVNMFSAKMAAIENSEAALGVSSGMAAISSTIEQIMAETNIKNCKNSAGQKINSGKGSQEAGGEIVSSLTVYGGTYALFKNIFPRQGIHTKFVNINNLNEVEAAITPRTKLIYTETMSNPLLNISDIQKLSALCKKKKIKLVVDNTFSPLIVSPIKWGADVVIHSCTKFISGSGDMIAGVICASSEFITSLIDVNSGVVMLKGPTMDARIAHELYLRLDHLPIRIKAHSEAAQFFAAAIEAAGVPTVYPGLKSHPHHSLLREMMNPEFGFGSMIAIDLVDPHRAMRLAQKLQEEKFGLYAVSLGFSRTLMSCPSVSTSSEVTEEDQKLMNLSPGLLRLSIGFTGDNKIMLERFLKCWRSLAL